jgi:hypothetical protein
MLLLWYLYKIKESFDPYICIYGRRDWERGVDMCSNIIGLYGMDDFDIERPYLVLNPMTEWYDIEKQMMIWIICKMKMMDMRERRDRNGYESKIYMIETTEESKHYWDEMMRVLEREEEYRYVRNKIERISLPNVLRNYVSISRLLL